MSQTTTVDEAPAETSDPHGGVPLMDHAYDGIREYDNPLPGWWRYTFWVSLFFSLGYVIVEGAGWMKTPDERYREARVAYASTAAQDTEIVASTSEDALASGARDTAVVAKGKAVFLAKCASCHTENGRGLIGPNLTDEFQLHGHTRLDLFSTIRDGVPNTAMLAWGSQMPAFDIVAVATFVTTLRGTNVAGKEPQGPKVGPF